MTLTPFSPRCTRHAAASARAAAKLQIDLMLDLPPNWRHRALRAPAGAQARLRIFPMPPPISRSLGQSAPEGIGTCFAMRTIALLDEFLLDRADPKFHELIEVRPAGTPPPHRRPSCWPHQAPLGAADGRRCWMGRHERHAHRTRRASRRTSSFPTAMARPVNAGLIRRFDVDDPPDVPFHPDERIVWRSQGAGPFRMAGVYRGCGDWVALGG